MFVPCTTLLYDSTAATRTIKCSQLDWAFLVQSVWFLFWWCPLDCFLKFCLSGTRSENSQAGWDLGNRMARGYWFDVKWICTMRSHARGIQVFCSRWWFEMRWCLISRTEHLNTSGMTSHGTDSFHGKPITPGHPIPKISTSLNFFWRGIWKTEFVKTIHR